MSRKIALILCAYAAAFAVGSAAAGGLKNDEDRARDAAKLAAAQAHAGAPVDDVRFLRPIDSIEVIDRQAVLVWETPFKAWLVELAESQSCRDLDRDPALGIDSMDQTLNIRNGQFRGRDGVRCDMTRIREVDVKAMRQALREAGNG